MKNTLKDWLLATRPWSFTASALSVIVVLAYLEWSETQGIDWLHGLWAVGAIVLFHAAGNVWSDWNDYRSGIDAPDTHGVDTLTSGRFAPASILAFSLVLYALACVAGVGLMLHTGLPLLWVGLAGLLGALLYPLLKRCALGDAVILLTYWLLPALGTSYVATGHFAPRALWAALPVGLLVVAILHSNNTRDMHTDRRAGATTLAHVLGVRGSVLLYKLEVLLPFVMVAALAACEVLPLWSLLVLQLLPLALRNCRAIHRYTAESQAAAISMLDKQSALLQMLFSASLTSSFLMHLL